MTKLTPPFVESHENPADELPWGGERTAVQHRNCCKQSHISGSTAKVQSMCLRGWVMWAAHAGGKPSICWAERPGCSFITVSARKDSSATLPVAVQIKFLTPGLSCHYFCTAPSLFSQLIQTIEMVKTYHCC